MRPQTPTLAITAFLLGIAAVLYALWILVAPHDWPMGDSGMIAMAAAFVWTGVFPLAGLIAGALSLARDEQPRGLVFTALLTNVAVVVALVISFLR